MGSGIPDFPEFREIELKDKKIFDAFFKKYPPAVSEFNFTELFSWRHSYRVKFTLLRGNLCLFTQTKKDQYFSFPIGDREIKETVGDIFNWQKSNSMPQKIRYVTEADFKKLGDYCEKLNIKDDRDFYDYVYLSSDLIELKGKKYDAKRNQIKRFEENCKADFIKITKELIPECLQFQRVWCHKRCSMKHTSLCDENQSIEELLNNFESLDVFGAVFKVNSTIEAMTIAGELNPETAVVHIEKANLSCHGVYQAINQMFCEKMMSKYKYVNREQDMGAPGLRKSKLSYHPHHMEIKKIIQPKD